MKTLTDEQYAKIIAALNGAKNHLEACQAGAIRHPFQSASLPLVNDVLAELEVKP